MSTRVITSSRSSGRAHFAFVAMNQYWVMARIEQDFEGCSDVWGRDRVEWILIGRDVYLYVLNTVLLHERLVFGRIFFWDKSSGDH